jgi:hypothetical protein
MNLTITAHILIQGPQAPAAGDGLTLSVYDYKVVEPAQPLHAGDSIQVAHLAADVDDPGFAVGQLRRLELERDFPPRASLLYGSRQLRNALPWYCPASSPLGGRS